MSSNSPNLSAQFTARLVRRRLFSVLAAACLFLFASGAAKAQLNVTYTGANPDLSQRRDWFSALNWSPNVVPSQNDTAIINADFIVEIAATQPVTVKNLTMSNGARIVSGNLTVSNTLTMEGININGSAVTVNGTMEISGSTSVTNGAQVTNNGTAHLRNNTLHVEGSPAAAFINKGTFNIYGGAGITRTPVNDASVFINEGVFRAISGIAHSVGSTTIAPVFFDNRAAGTIKVEEGTLTFTSTTVVSNGTLNTPAANATDPSILFQQGSNLVINGGQITGSGFTEAQAQSTVLLKANVTVPRFRLKGKLEGDKIIMTIPDGGVFEWQDGVIEGFLNEVIIAEDAKLAIKGTSTLDSAIIQNLGTIDFELGATLNGANGAYIDNNETAKMLWRKNVIQRGAGAKPVINNYGLIEHVEGVTMINWKINNITKTPKPSEGAPEVVTPPGVGIEAKQGSLVISGDVVTKLPIFAETGTILEFRGPTTLDPGSSLAGDGFYNVDTTSAILEVNTDILVNQFNLKNGMMIGTSHLACAFNCFWTGGTVKNSFDVSQGATLTLNNGAVTLDGGTINDFGTINYSEAFGQGSLNMINNATLKVSGMFNYASAVSILNIPSSPANININSGTLTRTVTAGTPGITPTFTLNSGTVNVNNYLGFNAFTMNGGTLTGATGGQIFLNGSSPLTLNGGTFITPTGNFNVNGFSSSGNGSVYNLATTISIGGDPGLGTFTIGGNYTQGNNGAIVANISGNSSFDRLIANGILTLSGNYINNMVGGFVPTTGTNFQTLSGSARSGTFITIGNLDTGNQILLLPVYNSNNFTLTTTTITAAIAPPVLTSASSRNNILNIQGTYHGSPNTTYTITFFNIINQVIGNAPVTTNGNGDATLNVIFQTSVFEVRATATNGNSTSNYSNELRATFPSVIAFSASNYGVGEGGGSVTITVNRTGDTSGASSVDFNTNDGSAKQALDYLATSGALSFGVGESSKTFNVVIVDDAIYDPNETLNLTLSNAAGATLAAPSTATITITDNDIPRSKKTGVFRPSTGELFLKNANSSGFADTYIIFGNPGDYPVAGDWNGDGVDSVGIYRNGVFFLRNTNSTGFADIVVPFGNPGDQPVVGDWNGDGVDTIGIYRNGTFILRNSNTAGPPDLVFTLGDPGDVGIAGDWNGDGITTCGVFRPSNGIVYLKNSNSTGFADLFFVFGNAGDQPVAGDWNGDGMDTVGIYRNGFFYLTNSNTTGFADIVFVLGNSGDFPIAGNWDGSP